MAERRKLALLAFEQGIGPWIKAIGTETGVKVSSLKDGERVSLEVEGLVGYYHCPEGSVSIRLSEGQMYRFIKAVPEGMKPSKTSVEVILNGG